MSVLITKTRGANWRFIAVEIETGEIVGVAVRHDELKPAPVAGRGRRIAETEAAEQAERDQAERDQAEKEPGNGAR